MNSNSSLFGDLLDGRLEKDNDNEVAIDNEVYHLEDNFLAGPVDTDAHIDDNSQQAGQWRHHSNNHINITNQEDNTATKDGWKGKGGVSPPKMVFNSLGVMELEHRFTGGQSITTTSSNPTTSSLYSSADSGDDEEEESSSSDDDDTDFIYEVDRHDHLYSTTNATNNTNSGRYQTTNFLDTASSIIDNLPVFNNSGQYTGTVSRECNIDDLECMGSNDLRGREDRWGGREGVSYESTSTRRYKKLKRKCMVGIVVLGLVGIVLGIYYGKGGTSSSQQEEIDRYYQIGSETDGIIVSDGVELVEGMGEGYANMSGENSAVAFHKINAGPEGWWCGTCSFKLRYSNGSKHQSRSYLIKMNGETLDTIKFDKTNSWSAWEYTKSITSYNCLGNNDGKTYNTVSVEIQNDGGKGYIYLDGLDFKLGTDDEEDEDGDKTTPEVTFQTFTDESVQSDKKDEPEYSPADTAVKEGGGEEADIQESLLAAVEPKDTTTKAGPLDRFYQVGDNEEEVILSDGVHFIKSVEDGLFGYAELGGDRSMVSFNKVDTGPDGGECVFKILYSNGSGNSRTYFIKVNDILVSDITFDPTESWSDWKYTQVITSNSDCVANEDGKTFNKISIELAKEGKGYIYLGGMDFKVVAHEEVDQADEDHSYHSHNEAEEDNLIVNGDFEDGLDKWYMNSGEFVLDETNVYSGSHSVLCMERKAHWNGIEQVIDVEKVQKDATYRVSCYAKIKEGAAKDKIKLTFRVQTYDEDDGEKTFYLGPELEDIVQDDINDSDWSYYEGQIALNVTGTILGVQFYVEGPKEGVEYWVDEISAVKVE